MSQSRQRSETNPLTVSTPGSPVFLLRSGFSLLALCLLPGSPLQASQDTACTRLERVDIEASSLFSPSARQAIIDPFLGSCIDADLTRRVLSDISNYFIDNGYVTTRPYLLEQDISDGQIEIRILIGYIEAIVDADSGASNGKIATAFMFNDEVLNLRELETSLETIERVSSVSAEIEIRPGTRQGGSIVAIKTVESEPLRLELGVNAQTDLDSQLSPGFLADQKANSVGRSFQSERRQPVYAAELSLLAVESAVVDFVDAIEPVTSRLNRRAVVQRGIRCSLRRLYV